MCGLYDYICSSRDADTEKKNHWTEVFWLELIDTVAKVEGYSKKDVSKQGGKWNIIAKLLPPNLLSQFSDFNRKPHVIRFRFIGLSWEVAGNRKPSRYTRGVTELVIRKMADHISKARDRAVKKENMKDSQSAKAPVTRKIAGHSKARDGAVKKENMKESQFAKAPSPSAEAKVARPEHNCSMSARLVHILECHMDKERNSLIKWLDEQLVPTAKRRWDSCCSRSRQILGESTFLPRVMKFAIKLAFQDMRAEIIDKMKQTTNSFSQEINKELAKAD